MKHEITHSENLNALKRVEGQVKGIQKMIADEKYCIDIIIQMHAAIHALYSVRDKIFSKHLKHCVTETFIGKSKKAKTEKIDELMTVIKQLRKFG